MLTSAQLERIASEAALKALDPGAFVRALTESTTDSEGRDAVLVTLVVSDLQRVPITGDQLLETILTVQQSLEAAGETRTPIVSFSTEGDLADDGGA